jgi:hypothetical protein
MYAINFWGLGYVWYIIGFLFLLRITMIVIISTYVTSGFEWYKPFSPHYDMVEISPARTQCQEENLLHVPLWCVPQTSPGFSWLLVFPAEPCRYNRVLHRGVVDIIMKLVKHIFEAIHL